jgi:hypothetical protein
MATFAMVRVRAVAVAAAIANFFIRVTPVFLRICANLVGRRVTVYIASAVPNPPIVIYPFISSSYDFMDPA